MVEAVAVQPTQVEMELEDLPDQMSAVMVVMVLRLQSPALAYFVLEEVVVELHKQHLLKVAVEMVVVETVVLIPLLVPLEVLTQAVEVAGLVLMAGQTLRAAQAALALSS
jgi:hypothetical protein